MVKTKIWGLTIPLQMTLDSLSSLLVYKELTFCCLSTMVYHNCVLKDGESVWNNGKSNVKDSRFKKEKEATERNIYRQGTQFVE